MKEKLVNNQSLKLISLGLAFVIWLAVVNISNPEVTRSKTVPLEIINAEALSAAGKTFVIQSGDSVAVSYQVRTLDAYRISADNFKASIDLKDLYDVTGSVPVSVEVVGNRDLISGAPAARPGVIRVLTEDIQNKSFALTTHPENRPADGYEVGSMRLKPDTVMISGPVSQVGRISSVGVRVDVSGAAEDLSGSNPVTYFDANGNEIEMEDERVQAKPALVEYYVDMLRGKTLPLRFSVSGEAARGYRLTGTECSVKSVAVLGEPELLESLREIEVPESALNISGARADMSVTVDLNDFLPRGASVSGESRVLVTMKVEPLNTMAYQLSLSRGIELRNASPDYVYRLEPEIISVELSAPPEVLLTVNAEALEAYVDAAGMEVGAHEGKLRLTAPEGVSVASVTPFTVSVSMEAEGPDASSAGQASVSSGGAGGGEAESGAEESSPQAGSGESGPRSGGEYTETVAPAAGPRQ